MSYRPASIGELSPEYLDYVEVADVLDRWRGLLFKRHAEVRSETALTALCRRHWAVLKELRAAQVHPYVLPMPVKMPMGVAE